MEEKSGLDLLWEIISRLDVIEKRISVLDSNIKKIANSAKLSELIEKAAGTKFDSFHATSGKPSAAAVVPKSEPAGKEKTKSGGFKNFSFNSANEKQFVEKPKAVKQKNPQKPKKIVVQGKMVASMNGSPLPIPGVGVKIYDSKDKLVKETKTNRAGVWVSHLLPGRYVAFFSGEYSGKKLVEQNRNFSVPKELPSGQDYLEIT